jgi:CRISPR-associated protein Cmr5
MMNQTEQSRLPRQRTLEQKRAENAFNCVREILEHHLTFKSEYSSLARGASAEIQTSGLGQTLGFWKAKGKEHHIFLYKHISNWVTSQLGLEQNTDLLTWLIKTATTDEYRQATAETMAFLLWLKRFAEAELKEG